MKNKGEKGSITLFVTVSCLFIMFMLVSFVINMENKKQAQSREINQIISHYTATDNQMEEIYTKIKDKEEVKAVNPK